MRGKTVWHNHNFGDNDSILAITACNLVLRRAPGGDERAGCQASVKKGITLSAFCSVNDRRGWQASLVSLVLVHRHGMTKKELASSRHLR